MFGFLKDKFSNQPFRGSKSFKERVLTNELLSSSFLYVLLMAVILTNLIGLFFPILISSDANLYAVIAKHIVINNDWVNLTHNNQDWIDKPHFPFWVIALSYKIFGISAFSYILPGFLFNLLGARYTYLLAKKLYTEQVAILATVIYLSALHLMVSAIDVRTEAYLLGEIIPAVYYLYLYYQNNNPKYMVLIAFFSALAIMTKGVFVLIVIYSGLITLSVYNKNYANFKDIRWLKVLSLTLLFILPELVVLYLQFDIHPEKYIYGQNNISGIKFFLFDGQFGRFFNFGLVHSDIGFDFYHLFYYLGSFLWSFAPWSFLFFISLWDIILDLRLSNDLPKVKEQKNTYLFLIGSFLPIFVLFSISVLQLEYYTNIIFPFAAIICANWVCNKATRFIKHPVFKVQVILSFILVVLLTLSTLLIFNGKLFTFAIALCIMCLALYAIFTNNRESNKAVSYPVIAVCLIFVFIMLTFGRLYTRYDAAYHINQTLESMVQAPVVSYQRQYDALEFHTDNKYMLIESIVNLNELEQPFYLVIESNTYKMVESHINGVKEKVDEYIWIPQDMFPQTLLSLNKRISHTHTLELFLITDKSSNVDKNMADNLLPVIDKPSAGSPKTKTEKVLVNPNIRNKNEDR